MAGLGRRPYAKARENAGNFNTERVGNKDRPRGLPVEVKSLRCSCYCTGDTKVRLCAPLAEHVFLEPELEAGNPEIELYIYHATFQGILVNQVLLKLALSQQCLNSLV